MKPVTILFGVIAVSVLAVLAYRSRSLPPPRAEAAAVTVVQGSAPPPAVLPPMPSAAATSAVRDIDRQAMSIDNVSHTLETDYPVIRHAEVTCGGDSCVLTATLNDISSEDQAASFDRLLNDSMGFILARNGFRPEERPVIEMMGGAYTGFTLRMSRTWKP